MPEPMTSPNPAPALEAREATAAAAEAEREWLCRAGRPTTATGSDWGRIRAMLKAAAPHLAAAERERCAQLAESVKAGYAARCEDPAHRDMVHAIRAVRLDADGGHLMSFAALLRGSDGLDVARDAEVLHAEHHPGTFVPSLDSCSEHDRSWYEQRVRDLQEQP